MALLSSIVRTEQHNFIGCTVLWSIMIDTNRLKERRKYSSRCLSCSSGLKSKKILSKSLRGCLHRHISYLRVLPWMHCVKHPAAVSSLGDCCATSYGVLLLLVLVLVPVFGLTCMTTKLLIRVVRYVYPRASIVFGQVYRNSQSQVGRQPTSLLR